MVRSGMRYLVHEMGWEKFQKLVLKERSIVEMTTSFSTSKLFNVKKEEEQQPECLSKLMHVDSKLPMLNERVTKESSAYKRWLHTNVVIQKQICHFTVFITLGAGHITA